MAFLNLLFSPKLYMEYGNELPARPYYPGDLERWGDKILSTLNVIWNIGYYTSPLIVTFLYRRGYLIADSLPAAGRISTSIGLLVFVSLCIRSLGRLQNPAYMRFMRTLQADGKDLLRRFDFDFRSWPVDFTVGELSDNARNAKKSKIVSSFWSASLPFELAAYVAIHTFGIRMIYPGSMGIVQSFLQPMLVQGRAKLITEESAQRYKVRTADHNDIDTIVVDNRTKSSPNGRTLVICSEGNAGFYEVGIMTTPLALNYSVLGWNHPGFGGSTGSPYPEQDHCAIDAVMQFAIQRLGFQPENIILYGWSIGGYSSIYAARQYPTVRGVILDATFDDVLQLAVPRMPQLLAGVVRIAIRQYVNLNNAELLNAGYAGPVLLIRRTEDEVISEDMSLTANRGNHLVMSLLQYRYPHVFQADQLLRVRQLLANPLSLPDGLTDQRFVDQLMSDLSEHGAGFPSKLGESFDDEERYRMAEFLLHKHMIDYKTSHCTPLPVEFFQVPWNAPDVEREYVFT